MVVRQFGGSRAASLIAGLWFVATMARFFEYYVGMNEPQLLGQAVMVWGLVWLLKRHAAGRAVEPAVLVMVLAGFVKHNFIVVPARGAALGRARQLAARPARRDRRRRGGCGRPGALRVAVRAAFHCRHADAAHL